MRQLCMKNKDMAMTTENKPPVYIPLEGVDSEHCALIVDKGLSAVKGILSHKVELNNQRAVITAENKQTLAEAVKAIRDLGYGVSTLKKTIPVLEMSCAACAVSVESIIREQAGVIDAVVNFATATVTVEYLPAMIRVEDLQKAVQSVGYDLLMEPGTSETETLDALHEEQYKRLKGRTIAALLLSAPLVVIGMFFYGYALCQ